LADAQPAGGHAGPGLLGPVDVNTQGYTDVWSNDISDVATRARQQEDASEAAAWEATKTAKGWTNGVPADASDADKSDYAIGVRREQARNTRVYDGSLTKRGDGTLFLTGNDTWHGTSTVLGGGLSVVGSHASSIDVRGGTLSGSGNVAGGIDVAGGTLKPGFTPADAPDVQAAPGNVLTSGGNVRIGRDGRLAVTVNGDHDYTSVRAAGDLVLDGELTLDVREALTPGSELTIMSGRSISGRFHNLPEGGLLNAGGHVFQVSYKDNSVTLTVLARAQCTTTITGRHSGPLTVTAGVTCLDDATVSGPITVGRGASLVSTGSTISGPVSATRPGLFTAHETTVSGPVTVTGSTGAVLIEKGRISGPVSLTNNTGGVRLDTMTISGPVTVTGNSGAQVVVAKNTVSGPLSCSGNSPAPGNDDRPNKVSGPKSGQCAKL